jgi:hypothetical protein
VKSLMCRVRSSVARKIDVVLAFIRVHSFFFHTKINVLRIRTL